MPTEEMTHRGAATTTKIIGLKCVADSRLGELTDGQAPVTRTGDYFDIVVANARIPSWPRVARFDSGEMGQAIPEIVDKLDTHHMNLDCAELVTLRDRQQSEPPTCDPPSADLGLRKRTEVLTCGITGSPRRARATDGTTEGSMRRLRQSVRSKHSSIVTSKVAQVRAVHCVKPDSSNHTSVHCGCSLVGVVTRYTFSWLNRLEVSGSIGNAIRRGRQSSVGISALIPSPIQSQPISQKGN